MKLQTIGQVAKRLGLRTSTLRYYEQEGLLTPHSRSRSGYRLYDEKACETLRFIQRAQRLGFSLADIGALLKGWQTGDLSGEAIIQRAEARYFALERDVTQLLVLQHELELFLQDMQQKVSQQSDKPAPSTLNQLLDHLCHDPLNQPPDTILNWLVSYTGCILQSSEAQALLHHLRGEHVHIWHEGDAYHILLVSNKPAIGAALEALAQLEADCQAHPHHHQAPELMHNEEGYLFIARGAHAFIFARLFLALEQEGREIGD